MLATAVPRGAELLFALIRSDQLTHEQVAHLLELNPLFARWYKATQLIAH